MDLKDILSGVQAGFQSKKGANALIGLGTGLLSGNTFAKGMAAGGQGYMQGAQLDDAEAQRMDRTTQWKSAIENIRTKYNRPDVADMLQSAGEGGIDAAWNKVIEGQTAAKPQFQEVGGKLVRIDGDQVSEAYDPYAASGGVNPKDGFSNEKDLYSQYASADPIKAYEAVKGGYERVRQGAQANTGAGDMSLIYGFMKMQDPGSVVRESEFAMAAQAGDFGEQIQGMVNRVLTGERLPETVRQQFVQAADGLYSEAAQNVTATNDQFTQRAGAGGVDPTHVIRQPEVFQPLGNGVFKMPNGNTIRQVN